MQSSNIIKPAPIQAPFCVNGTKNIPNYNASGTETSSFDLGFLPITSEALPPDGNGRAPERKDFNGMFYVSTDQRVYLQNGSLITFDEDVSDEIGGYPKGAILAYKSANGLDLVESVIEDNTQNFVATPALINGSVWKYVSFPSINSAIKSAADGQWVLLNQSVHNGSLAAASETPLPKTVNVPNDNRIYDVLFSVSVETGSSSGNAIYVNMRGNVLNAVFQVAGCRTRANNEVGSRGCALIPMKYASNNLYITRTATMSGTANITAVAYRRVGTNT